MALQRRSRQRSARPTAENVFKAFVGPDFLRARTTIGREAIADPLSPVQQAILDSLEIASVLPPEG